MEQRFLWLVELLTRGSPIPVLDCYSLNSNKVTKYFSMNQELSSESPDPVEILSKVYREFALIRRLGHTNSIPCYFFIDQIREPVSIEELEWYVKSGVLDRNVNAIQIPKPCCNIEEYTCTATKGRTPILYNAHRRDVRDPDLTSQVKAIVKQVFKKTAKYCGKQTHRIELDFQADSNGLLWISDLRYITFNNKPEKSNTLLRSARILVKKEADKTLTARATSGKNTERSYVKTLGKHMKSYSKFMRSKVSPRQNYQ